jgi:hypothetical protein
MRGLRRHHGQLELDGGSQLHADQAKGRRHLSSAMDTEHRVIAELLALKDAPDDVLLDQVETIGERAARHMLCDEAARLQHTDHATSMDCAALIDRIDALIQSA